MENSLFRRLIPWIGSTDLSAIKIPLVAFLIFLHSIFLYWNIPRRNFPIKRRKMMKNSIATFSFIFLHANTKRTKNFTRGDFSAFVRVSHFSFLLLSAWKIFHAFPRNLNDFWCAIRCPRCMHEHHLTARMKFLITTRRKFQAIARRWWNDVATSTHGLPSLVIHDNNELFRFHCWSFFIFPSRFKRLNFPSYTSKSA